MMTEAEIYEKKRELEESIGFDLDDFEKETGIKITHISTVRDVIGSNKVFMSDNS